MITKTVILRDTNYATGWYADFGERFDEAIKEACDSVGLDRSPDSIQFSSTQTTSSGGQNYTLVALLTWRPELD